MHTSYDKKKIKILLLENISAEANDNFIKYGYDNIEIIGKALSEEELMQKIKGVHVLGIRSKTQITNNILQAADKLLTIGCFCIGTNQVNLQEATKKGICVFNAPYSNTRSVAEITIGTMIMLIRRVFDKSSDMHKGVWNKDAANCRELRGKTVGIIGYGNIGTQVSILCEALGARVVFYDVQKKLPLGNAVAKQSLEDLAAQSDIITLHVPHNESTYKFINESFLSSVKHGSLFINFARGEVVDAEAVATALDNGILGGAAMDVFEMEPEKNGPYFTNILQNKPNVILTPHIGGSTTEAQQQIGIEVSHKLIDYVESGSSAGSKSIPELSLPMQIGKHRILHIHKNVPGVLSSINGALGDRNINIAAQYLKTNDEVGYVVVDVDQDISKLAADVLKQIPETIKIRSVY